MEGNGLRRERRRDEAVRRGDMLEEKKKYIYEVEEFFCSHDKARHSAAANANRKMTFLQIGF